ncbi:MAG: hypothetical protein ABIF01_01990, partial [Candidatus Micrarchaeota archaeon]
VFFGQNAFSLRYYREYGLFFFKVITTTFFPAFHLYCEHAFRGSFKEKIPLSFFLNLYGPTGAFWHLYRSFVSILPPGILRNALRLAIGKASYPVWESYWGMDDTDVQKRSWL